MIIHRVRWEHVLPTKSNTVERIPVQLLRVTITRPEDTWPGNGHYSSGVVARLQVAGVEWEFGLQRLAVEGLGVELDEDAAAPFACWEGVFRSFEIGVTGDVAKLAETELLQEVGVGRGKLVFVDEDGCGECEVGVERALFARWGRGSGEGEVKDWVETGGSVGGECEGGGSAVMTGREGERCWICRGLVVARSGEVS